MRHSDYQVFINYFQALKNEAVMLQRKAEEVVTTLSEKIDTLREKQKEDCIFYERSQANGKETGQNSRDESREVKD